MIAPAAESSDEVFAARAAAGDDAAFEALVVRYQHRVFRLASRLTSETDAPDVVQDTFLQMYRHLSTFRGDAHFSTWVYRIATNAGLMHRRARARRPAERGNARGAADSIAYRRDARAAREAFVLRDLEELTTSEVAQVLGVEPATVRQRVHRARLLVRGYLGELAGGRP